MEGSTITVSPGEPIHKGQIIGEVGISGDVCGEHLHYSELASETVNENGFGNSTESLFSSSSVCNNVYKGNPQYYHPLTTSAPYYDVDLDGIVDVNYKEKLLSDNY
ncbi:MAG: hypothetical protein Kow0081_2580 [Candidatus Dojkabacteria bacterium]